MIKTQAIELPYKAYVSFRIMNVHLYTLVLVNISNKLGNLPDEGMLKWEEHS